MPEKVNPDHEIKQNETELVSTQFLTDSDDPRDISAVSAKRFLFEDPDGRLIVNAEADFVTDGTDGKLEYELSGPETGVAGLNEGEFRVEFPDGEEQVSPSGDDYISVLISEAKGAIDAPDVDTIGELTGSLNLNGYSLLGGAVAEFRTIRDVDTGVEYDVSDLDASGGGGSGITVVDEDTITGIGGGASGEPDNVAQRKVVTIDGAAQDDKLEYLLFPNPGTTQPNVDFDFRLGVSEGWDQSAGVRTAELTVFWDAIDDGTGTSGDPGSGNDIEFRWQAVGPSATVGNTPNILKDGTERVADVLNIDFRADTGIEATVTEASPGTARVAYAVAVDSIGATELKDDAVGPDQLNSSDTIQDGEVPEWDAGASEWVFEDNGAGSTTAATDATSGIAVDEDIEIEADGATQQFTLPHSLGVVPGSAVVIPKSAPASVDFELIGKTASDVTIDYTTEPPDGNGSNNLKYDLLTVSPAGDLNRRDFSNSGVNLAANDLFTGFPYFSVADGESVTVYAATLLADDGTAVPSGVDLEIRTADGNGDFTFRTTVLSGGSRQVDQRGNPLATWTNSTGSPQDGTLVVNNSTSSSVSGVNADGVVYREQ